MELLGCLLANSGGDEGSVPLKHKMVFPKGIWADGEHIRHYSQVIRSQMAMEDPDEQNKGEVSVSQVHVQEKAALTHLPVSERWMWWQADAYLETTPCMRQFVKSFIFEIFPFFICAPVCLLLEGRQSMLNRMLLPDPNALSATAGTFIFQQLILVPIPWTMLILFLVYRPPGVHFIDVGLPMASLMYRGICIALKYSYFSPSDIQMVQRDPRWRSRQFGTRSLGVNNFFDVLGLKLLEISERLLKSVAFLGLREQFKTNHFTVEAGGHPMWTAAKEQLELAENMPDRLLYSKYGDPFTLLGLGPDDIPLIDARVQAGQLPVSVVAWYFASKFKGVVTRGVLIFASTLCLALAFMYPIVRTIEGRSAFGDSFITKVVFGLRIPAMFFLSYQPVIFIMFPAMIGRRSVQKMLGLLASFQQTDALAMQLCNRTTRDASLPIACMNDLCAFWTLIRVLGPTYDAGHMIRYNSAFIAASVGLLLAAVGVTNVVSQADGAVPNEALAEISMFFALGSVFVVVSALLCMRVNGCVSLFSTLARRAALIYPAIGGVAKDVIADFSLEHGEIRPIEIMYMTASPALVSFFLSGMVVLASLFASLLPAFQNICVPFLFTSGC